MCVSVCLFVCVCVCVRKKREYTFVIMCDTSIMILISLEDRRFAHTRVGQAMHVTLYHISWVNVGHFSPKKWSKIAGIRKHTEHSF